MDCLNPPLEHVPIEDWFCPQCDGFQPLQTGPVRRTVQALTRRVRNTVQRNRQTALRTARKKATPKKKTRKRKSTSPKKRKTGRKRKVRRKGGRKKANAVPAPRQRLASALGLRDKFSLPTAAPSQFSLFGDSNALDDNE